jgi:hypothetical protein
MLGMKQALTIVALGTVLLAGSAIAQSPPAPPASAPVASRSIKIPAEQSYIIKAHILQDAKPATTGSGAKLEINGKAPNGTALQDFPPIVLEKVASVKGYKFFVADNQVVIVDPKDNTIADILK